MLPRRSLFLLSLPSLMFLAAPRAWSARPNIVIVLADDLGYGDAHCLNPQGKIVTPNIDRLARAGMLFTDAHSGSAVCSPTRYGLLRGRSPGEPRWPAAFSTATRGDSSRRAGSRWRRCSRTRAIARRASASGILAWTGSSRREDSPAETATPGKSIMTRPFASGPRAAGFDDYFGISASLDMPPYVFLESDHATVIPTVEKKWIRQRASREGIRGNRRLAPAHRAGPWFYREAGVSGKGRYAVLPVSRILSTSYANRARSPGKAAARSTLMQTS